jgi:thioredoxin-like negative regulator of GroEL
MLADQRKQPDFRSSGAAWPMNTSIAASLAREYLNAGQTDKAAQALKHFQVTSSTPQQEMEEAVLVYFAAHQLASAHAVARYRSLRACG